MSVNPCANSVFPCDRWEKLRKKKNTRLLLYMFLRESVCAFHKKKWLKCVFAFFIHSTVDDLFFSSFSLVPPPLLHHPLLHRLPVPLHRLHPAAQLTPRDAVHHCHHLRLVPVGSVVSDASFASAAAVAALPRWLPGLALCRVARS